MLRRWRTVLAIVVYIVAFAISVLTTGLPFIVPLSFLVICLIAWDFGMRASLAWIAFAHLVLPVGMVLAGVGPFYVFAEARVLVVIFTISGIIAGIALAYLTVRLRLVNDQLHSALAEVKELRGFLPICAWCKDIRDVSGNWENLESYLARHSRATFTHGLCPKCLEEQLREAAEANDVSPP